MKSSIGMFILYGLVCQSYAICNFPIFGHECPKSCVCNRPWFMSGAFVDCSARGLALSPDHFPQNTVELDLSENHLVHVPYLKKLHRLRKLDIAHNRLEDVGVESLNDHICDLEELVLAKNQITKFPTGLPKSLVHLDLNENVISTLTCTLLSALPPVKNLILSKNMLSVLTKDSFCPNFGVSPPLSAVLHNLDLSGNNIHILEEGVFRCLTQLEKLNLSGNLLSLIGAKEFKGLTTLRILDLSNNALLQVGEGSFNNMPNLYYLNLRRNQLTSVPRSLAANIYVLDVSNNAIAVLSEDKALFGVKHVLIGHNPLICDCRIRWIRQHLISSIPVSLRREDCPIDLPIPSNEVLIKDLAPRCANPPSLAGKALEQVEETKLICCVNNNNSCGSANTGPRKCTQGVGCLMQRPINRRETMPPHTSSKVSFFSGGGPTKCECPNLPENPWARVHHINRSNLLVEWTIPSALEGSTVEVQFYIFGYRSCKLTKKVPILDQKLMLSYLKPNTNYIICVMPTHCANTETPVLLNSCFEVRTADVPLFHKLTTIMMGSCTSNMRMLCGVVLALIFVGFMLMFDQIKYWVMGETKVRACM